MIFGIHSTVPNNLSGNKGVCCYLYDKQRGDKSRECDCGVLDLEEENH